MTNLVKLTIDNFNRIHPELSDEPTDLSLSIESSDHYNLYYNVYIKKENRYDDELISSADLTANDIRKLCNLNGKYKDYIKLTDLSWSTTDDNLINLKIKLKVLKLGITSSYIKSIKYTSIENFIIYKPSVERKEKKIKKNLNRIQKIPFHTRKLNQLLGRN
jgi:hypothetical protein